MRNVRMTAWALVLALSFLPVAWAKKSSSHDESKEDSEGAAAENYRSAGMCIAPETPERVNACNMPKPKGKLKSAGGGPKSKLRQSKRKIEEPKGMGPTGPSIELDVATLRNKDGLQVRAKKLLTREIQVTRRLLKNMKTSDKRRADVLLRLAEGYFELTQVASREVRKLDDPIYEACQVKKDRKRCGLLRKKQRTANDNLGKVREANIKTLATLVKDHSNFKKMDEVLFSLGFSLEEMKQFDRARQVYHRLIKAFPQSAFIPNAYLSFAEYYFQQGDMRAAQQFYQKVTEIPPERNKVYGYAVYKQAWCHYNLEDYKAALQSFVETIEFGKSNPEAHSVANLMKQSRRELVMPYAQVGNPGRALDFFSRYAKDEDQAFEMFESLGELYFDTGKWPQVIAIYHELMAERSKDDKLCYWQTRVTNAVVSSKPKKAQVTEVQRMLDVWDSYNSESHSEEAQKTCKQASASVLIDLATAWHREAIGTDTQPGTNDRGTMEQASKLYRLVLTKFPDMESMKFPNIDKRDWPTEYKVSYYYAELLWRMESWAECGPAFDKVLEVNAEGEYTEDAAYASVLCYNKQYLASYAKRETQVRGKESGKKGRRKKKREEPTAEELAAQFRPKEFSPLEQGMLRAYQRYVCFVQGGDDIAQIKYRRARIYYESNHYEEAATIFKDIAFNHKDSELAVFAANLFLDSLNVLGSHSQPTRPACYDDMNDAIEPLYKMYCGTDGDREDNDELCSVLEQLRCDLLRKKAEALQSNKDYKPAAQLYVRIFRKYSECGSLDEVLYNASINFEAARLLGRAIQVRKVLIDRFPESDWAMRAMFLIGANYHALAFYEVAADFYEQFAEKYPKQLGAGCSDRERELGTCVIANEALQNAVFFRLGLGDEERALEDAKLFERNYKKKFPRETSQVVYSIGSIYERQEDWAKLIGHYRSYLKRYRKTAMPHEVIEANVASGRATLAMTKERKAGVDRRGAHGYFQSAIKTWQGAKERFGSLPVSDTDKARYLAMAKIGTAEALFHLGDEEFDKYREVSFPVFKAKTKARGRMAKQKELQEKFQKWMQEDFVKWLGTKSAALQKAQKSYESIADLKVPQWDIAAAARIGDMYLALVNDFRDAPVPPVLKADEELVDIYYQGLDEASKPWVARAKDAYEFCLITATKVRWFNKFMTSCERELFKLDPRKYPRAMELRGSDTYSFSAHAVPGVPALGAGEAGAK